MEEMKGKPNRRRIVTLLRVGFLGLGALTLTSIVISLAAFNIITPQLDKLTQETIPILEQANHLTMLVRKIDSQARNLPNLHEPFAIGHTQYKIMLLTNDLTAAVDKLDPDVVGHEAIEDARLSIEIMNRQLEKLVGYVSTRANANLRQNQILVSLVALYKNIDDLNIALTNRGVITPDWTRFITKMLASTRYLLTSLTNDDPSLVMTNKLEYNLVLADLQKSIPLGDETLRMKAVPVVKNMDGLKNLIEERFFYLRMNVRVNSAIKGLAALDRLVTRINDISTKLTNAADEQSQEMKRLITRLGRVLILISIACILGVILFLLFLNRRLVRRMEDLTKGMLSHVSGQPDPIRVEGADEITDMARSFLFYVGEVRRREESLQQRTRELDEANQDLQDSERRLSDIIEFLPDPTFVIDTEGRVMAWNQAMEGLTGVLKSDMLDRGEYEYALPFYQERRPVLIDLVLNWNEEARDKYSDLKWSGDRLAMEAFFPHLGQEGIFISGTSSPLYDSAGGKVGAIECIRDVTERKKAERERDEAFEVITSSINYASRIQRAILPPMELLDEATQEYFILWKPRDVVGGDIYWCHKWGGGMVLILGDCTGHGVPGAFMTLISNGALERALIDINEGDSAALISRMHQLIQVALGQDRKESEADDGLELGVCYIPPAKNDLVFAGAGFPLFIVEKNEISMIKGDRKGIGYRKTANDTSFTNHPVENRDSRTFYMSSDGLFDQIGGEKRRGFGKKRFKRLLASLATKPLSQQGDNIYQHLIEYQGQEKRRDDVSVIGFRFSVNG